MVHTPFDEQNIESGYSRLRHLVNALRGSHDPDRTLVATILTGYFDASGAPDQGTVLVAGGFISSEARWLQLEEPWNVALRDASIQCFHMSEFINRKGEFEGWTQSR